MKNVLEFLENSAKKRPEAVACGDERGELSYARLLAASQKEDANLDG